MAPTSFVEISYRAQFLNQNYTFCYEIIEHLLEPKSFLKRIYNEMREGSFLIITTPNADGLDNKKIPPEQKDRFIASALFPPYHLNAFFR